LAIAGTLADDDIQLNQHQGSVRVSIDDFPRGSFAATGRLLVYAGPGDDHVQIVGNVDLPAWIYGGPGDDKLRGGKGDDVIFGEAGDDTLHGGQGRDLLIGGSGRDEINGHADDDILIAGTTSYDALAIAWWSIWREWTSGHSFDQRTANIAGTGSGPSFAARLNDNYFLRGDGPGATVHDDNERDVLVGSTGRDWFFANLHLSPTEDATRRDVISDLHSNELAEDLDFFS
jgi:Ca2+-binding RTX toxin-like protein